MSIIKRKIRSIVRKNKFLFFLYYNVLVKYRIKKKRKIISKYGYDLLKDIHRILNQEKIKFFIDFGTLLGMIRDNGFIKYDLDIDIGVIGESAEIVKKVKEHLINGGYIFKSQMIFKEKIVKQKFLYKQIKIDISYYEQGETTSKCYLFYIDYEANIIHPKNYFSAVQMTYDKIEGIKKYQIGDYEFNIPINTERLLEQKYGDDWTIPDSKWVYWESPSAKRCKALGFRKVYK